ncbi:solute carrier family 25 member 32-like isoform X2 [Porites lutea]|uniref:solute carrier family 25 member 32-like isoform X2 n=1 Tax=Porites lutea TaxID=51062 RepID=UPI003CC68088
MSERQAIPERPPASNSPSVTRFIRYEHLVAGVSGGVTSTLVLHPLDLIKIRFQVNDGSGKLPAYRGLVDAVQSIVRTGGLKGLYQGVTPNVWGNGSAWGLYFFSYNILKAWMQKDSDKPLGAEKHLLAGAIAGTGTLTVTNPIWVIKTRLCLQYTGSPAAVTQAPQYKGMIDALFKLWRHEGLRGLYKGYVPGLFGVSHGALQFMAYEELKKGYSHYFGTPINKKLSSTEYLIMASLSKIFAATATYPYQVVRSRLQNQYTMAEYNGAVDVIRKTFRYEGVRGFYKGLVPNVLRVTPACALTFVVYENVIHFLMPSS